MSYCHVYCSTCTCFCHVNHSTCVCYCNSRCIGSTFRKFYIVDIKSLELIKYFTVYIHISVCIKHIKYLINTIMIHLQKNSNIHYRYRMQTHSRPMNRTDYSQSRTEERMELSPTYRF